MLIFTALVLCVNDEQLLLKKTLTEALVPQGNKDSMEIQRPNSKPYTMKESAVEVQPGEQHPSKESGGFRTLFSIKHKEQTQPSKENRLKSTWSTKDSHLCRETPDRLSSCRRRRQTLQCLVHTFQNRRRSQRVPTKKSAPT